MLINSWEYEWVIKIVSGSKVIVSGSTRSWIQDTRDWKVASRILWLEVHSNQTRLRQLLWFLHSRRRLLRQNIQRQQQELLWLWFQARIFYRIAFKAHYSVDIFSGILILHFTVCWVNFLMHYFMKLQTYMVWWSEL